MALAALAAGARLGRRLSGSGPELRPGRRHWTAAGRSRSRREADTPVFQYVGERAARADRIFVWGFSFSGALGVPTFVLPGAGPEPRSGSRPRRRIQPVPYRLELDQKVRAAAPRGLRRCSSARSWEARGVRRRGGGPSRQMQTREGRALGRCSHLSSGCSVPVLCPTGVLRTSPPESGLAPQLQFHFVVALLSVISAP